MSLMEKTRIFAADYCKQYRATFGRAISFDFDPASKEFATLWKMRHSADIWNVSYPLYLEVAFGLFKHHRYADRLAVPSSIFAKREGKPTWVRLFAKLWDERANSEYGRVARMAQYWRVNDKGLPAQSACRSRLVKSANSKRRYQYFAETYSVGSRIVPPGDFLSAISDPGERAAVVSAIRDSVESSRVIISAVPALEEGSLVQTCFGLPRTPKWVESACSTCVDQPTCAQAWATLQQIPDPDRR